MKILAMMLALVVVGAAPATGPTKPLPTLKDILAQIPNNCEPKDGKSWTKVQIELANNWLLNHAWELDVYVNPAFDDSQVTDDGVDLRCMDTNVRFRDCTATNVIADLHFARTELQSLGEYGKGDKVPTVGTIKSIKLEIYDGPTAQSLTLGVAMEDCHVNKEEGRRH